jgi:hypothetical protein
MIATSTEARALKKAGVDRSEGSEQRWQQEFVGRGRSGLGRFESSSPKSDDHTSANLVLDSQAKLGVEERQRWDILGMWTLVKAARRYSPSTCIYPRPERGELGRSTRVSRDRVAPAPRCQGFSPRNGASCGLGIKLRPGITPRNTEQVRKRMDAPKLEPLLIIIASITGTREVESQ